MCQGMAYVADQEIAQEATWLKPAEHGTPYHTPSRVKRRTRPRSAHRPPQTPRGAGTAGGGRWETDEIQKLRVQLLRWIEHTGKHAAEFRKRAQRAGPARSALLAAAQLLEEADGRLLQALRQLGGPPARHHH